MHARVADHYPRTTFHTVSNPTVTLVRNGPLNTACRTLIEESSGCEDDQAALQGAENRSCLAQVMRSGTVGLEKLYSLPTTAWYMRYSPIGAATKPSPIPPARRPWQKGRC